MFKKLTSLILFLILIVQVQAQSGYSIFGRISDENSQALPGANVYLPELEIGGITDPDGVFNISGIPQGRFVIHISFIGFETGIRTIFVSDKDIEINLKLSPSMISGKEVVISGGRHESQHRNSVKIESIKAESFNRSGQTGLVENISAMPGVDLIGNGGGIVTPVIRGLSTSNILMLNNGVRMENYQFSSDHPYLVDESGISQVEIIKGPASLLYGSDAIGGIINIINDYSVEPNSIHGEANLKYFSNTQGYGGNIGVHGNHGMLTWSVHGGTRSHKDFTDGSAQQVFNSRFNGSTVKSYAGLRFNKSLHRIRYEYQQFKPGMVNDESFGLINNNERSAEYWYQDLDNHLASLTNSWYLRNIKLHANAGYQKNFRKLITDEPDHHSVDMALTSITYETRGHLVTSEISEFTVAIQGMNQQNVNRDGEIRVLPDYRFNDIGFFGMVKHDFINRVHLQVGLRYDNRILNVPTQEKASHSHDEPEPDPDPEPEILDGFQKFYGNVSGSIGATFEIGEGVLLRSNLASAYRAPTVAELTQDGEHGIRYEQGNRDLKSQRSYEVDASFHFHKERLLFDLAAYYNGIDNYIFLGPTADTTDEGLTIYRYLQNDATLYGFEGALEILPLRNLNLKLAYNFTRGNQAEGKNLPLIPHNKILSEATYTFNNLLKKGSIYIKLGGDYAFAQDHPSDNEQASPSWFILHAGTGIDIPVSDHRISFSIQVRNLLNKSYVDHLSVLRELPFYNQGRNVVFSLSVPFAIMSSSEN